MFLAGREEQRTIAKTISRGGIAAKLSPIKEACLSARSIHPSSARVRRENTRGEERRKSNESARSVFGHYSAIPCFGSGFIRNQEGAT